MNCTIHAPTSIADAQAIAACFGGTNWRDLALLGLGTVLFVGLLLVVVLLGLRQGSGR